MPEPRPYKSTTHEEGFTHFQFAEPVEKVAAVSVFIRKEDDGKWYGADARCSVYDHFCRETGRKISRQRYFRDPESRIELGEQRPSYEELWTWFVEL